METKEPPTITSALDAQLFDAIDCRIKCDTCAHLAKWSYRCSECEQVTLACNICKAEDDKIEQTYPVVRHIVCGKEIELPAIWVHL